MGYSRMDECKKTGLNYNKYFFQFNIILHININKLFYLWILKNLIYRNLAIAFVLSRLPRLWTLHCCLIVRIDNRRQALITTSLVIHDNDSHHPLPIIIIKRMTIFSHVGIYISSSGIWLINRHMGVHIKEGNSSLGIGILWTWNNFWY